MLKQFAQAFMQAKNDAYPFKGIFARFTEYAGKADLNKCFWKQKENWG